MSGTHISNSNLANRRGSTIFEFAIVAPFLIVALLGVAGFGISLGRYIQALQVCRDVAHMFVDGVDFTQPGNQALIVLMAQGSGMTATGGNGVVMMSRISTVYQADCDAANYSGSCNNLGLAVFTQRIAMGNKALRTSAFGTPSTGIIDDEGNISSSVYLRNTDSSVRASGFTPLLTAAGLTQGQGDAAWVAEVYFSYPDLGFLGTNQPAGMYARFIF